MNKKEIMKCPKCGGRLSVKGGRKQQAKAIAKLLITARIEYAHVCSRCSYVEKSQTFIQK